MKNKGLMENLRIKKVKKVEKTEDTQEKVKTILQVQLKEQLKRHFKIFSKEAQALFKKTIVSEALQESLGSIALRKE